MAVPAPISMSVRRGPPHAIGMPCVWIRREVRLHCLPGYEGDGITCTNIDECAEGLDTCAENAICEDTEGSFECTCLPGYVGDGIVCENIDECALELDDCDENAVCQDTEGRICAGACPGTRAMESLARISMNAPWSWMTATKTRRARIRRAVIPAPAIPGMWGRARPVVG